MTHSTAVNGDSAYAYQTNWTINPTGALTITKVNNSYTYDMGLTPCITLLKIVPTI